MIDAERRLDSRQAAAFLTDLGFKIAPSTLAKLKCLRQGPQCELFGRKPLYTERGLLDWATAKARPAKDSASDPAEAA